MLFLEQDITGKSLQYIKFEKIHIYMVSNTLKLWDINVN